MDGSMILHESGPDTSKDTIQLNGKEYFNIKIYRSPEVSGLYEIIVDHDSSYYYLITHRLFIPIIYYDKKEDSWYLNDTKIDIQDTLQCIGWRCIETV